MKKLEAGTRALIGEWYFYPAPFAANEIHSGEGGNNVCTDASVHWMDVADVWWSWSTEDQARAIWLILDDEI